MKINLNFEGEEGNNVHVSTDDIGIVLKNIESIIEQCDSIEEWDIDLKISK